MAMRLSGLMSGMDTESLISQLVDAKGTKVKTAKKDQIRANWKQEAWKGLNTKLKNLQSRFVSNMRFSSAYSKLTTKVSNSSAISVITGADAVAGVQSLEVNQLAKTGYLTGAELKSADGQTKGEYTAMTKLSELGVSGSGTFQVESAKGTERISFDENTTISDVLSQMKKAGLNANFDTKTQRFFISAKESGVSNDFSITASDANGDAMLEALGLKVSLKQDEASLARYQKYAGYFVEGDRDQTLANMKSLIDASIQSKTDVYLEKYKSAQKNIETAQEKIDKINEKYKDDPLQSAETYATDIDAKKKEIEDLKNQRKNDVLTEDDKSAIDEKIKSLQEEVDSLTAKKSDAEALAVQTDNINKAKDIIADAEQYIQVTSTSEDGKVSYSAVAGDKLIEQEKDAFYNMAAYAAQVMKEYDPDTTVATGATKISGQDAIITLNGAEFTNNSNVFEINGLTFTALSETKEGESVTITTEQDTDGIYDMVKNFLKEYNAVINEIDKLYNADSAKGYDPLLSEEKEALSDTEVEEYEKKIKDALLRNDSNLSSISTALKTAMATGIEVGGKTMYLSSFGINTLGYFNAPDNEKNAFHIDGDADDENTSGNADKLKSMIASDPDTVISFFTKLSQNLYEKMADLSKSVDGYRSFGSFYDDKKMKSEYTEYNSKISDLEQKLNDYEDKWYKKFAAMESAMAKMQSGANAIAGLIGGM